jgi:glycosyltransferase involved in cell wall biosynthesis
MDLKMTPTDLTPHQYSPLPQPVRVSEQDWPEGTVPLVSICCITYNHEKFIQECLDSFLMQKTTFPVEILIHDDASTDNTANIIREYVYKYRNIIKPIFQKENQFSKGEKIGITFNYNRSKSLFIALCEGDDYWIDELKLEEQIYCLLSDVRFFGSFHETAVMRFNKITDKKYGNIDKQILTTEDTIAILAPFHTSSFVFRTDILPILSNTPRVTSGDMLLFSVVSSYGPIRKVSGVKSVYRKHDSGITSSSIVIDNYHQDRINLIRFLDEFHEFKFHEKSAQVIAYHENAICVNKAKIKKTWFKNNEKIISFFDYFLKNNQKKHCRLSNTHLYPQPTLQKLDIFYIRKAILDAIKSQRHRLQGDLLDVGCGKMPYKQLFSAPGSGVSRYIGLDFAINPIHDNQPDICWKDNRIPLEDSSVDSALCTEVLEHCPEPEAVLTEIYRVLRPGGILFFTVPFLWPLHEVPFDQYRYTPFALRRHLENACFDNIEVYAMGGWDASLAQMLGLWVRRRPMQSTQRWMLSVLTYPVYRWLIRREDTFTDAFQEQTMMTGLWGTATKQK